VGIWAVLRVVHVCAFLADGGVFVEFRDQLDFTEGDLEDACKSRTLIYVLGQTDLKGAEDEDVVIDISSNTVFRVSCWSATVV
jgi:hypothetical protein